MKINKRGSQQIPSTAQPSGFHSRKNSLRDPQLPSTNQLAQTANLNGLLNSDKLHQFHNLLSESQPVLAKANEKPNILLSHNSQVNMHHKRNPSHQTSQQLSLNEQVLSSMSGNSAGGAYMLKLQKYKKMKSELNNQTKNVIKKCIGGSNVQSNSNSDISKIAINTLQSHKASCQTIVPSVAQTTKNSQTQQILFNHPHQIEQSSKENSNYIANSQHYLASQQQLKNQKSSTIKFSINNLLNELSTKSSANTSQIKVTPDTSTNKLLMQNVIAAKNHSTLMSQSNKNHQQLASSKMMMALHKKCNSIANSTNVSTYQASQRDISAKPQSSNVTCLVLDQDNYNTNQSTKEAKKAHAISQVEFFDENVRVNQVPQITPRHQDKRKTITQPNERYKNIDQPLTAKNEYVAATTPVVPLNILNDFNNVQLKKESVKVPNNRYQEEDSLALNQNIFEIKRRSCGPVEGQHQHGNQFLDAQLRERENQLLQSQRFNNGSFGLRKFSQQVQFSNKLINKQEEMRQNSKVQVKPQVTPVAKSNPKEEIISFFSKYIKQTQFNDNKSPEEESEYEETIQNLKDFLQYLEDKNIINCKKLENDKAEMTNLIQDLMKLDLNKFSNKQPSANTCKNSPITNHQYPPQSNNNNIYVQAHKNAFNSRRNSAENEIKSPLVQNNQDKQQYRHKLPLNSPNNEQHNNNNNIVCYYAPVNVNGNGNIVNAGFQIFPQQKPFNCSQKLFINSQLDEEDLNEALQLRVQQQQQQQQQQPIFFKQPIAHKRVNSIGSALNKVQTPSSSSQVNNKLNFGFGGGQVQPPIVVLDPQQDQAKHFHQRKNSLFVQQQQNHQDMRQQFYQNQVEIEDDTDENSEAVPIKSSLTHRRATTNLIQPVQQMKNAQTIQPIVASNGATFNDDFGLIEERDKLIKYIKLYTSKRLEVPITTLDYYKFMKLIGKGAFGKVTLGIHKLTGKQVAIKTVDKSLMKDEYQKKKVLQEVHLLKKVRHQNVIRLLEVFESPKHLLMVMEYAGGGDLLQYVKKRRRLDEDEARRIFRQIVYGLAHCHCRSVLHRDIKLDNILLDNEGEIKICDFGVSRIIKKNQRITEQCGTPAYIAPEIISDAGYEGFNADVWSLGVLLYAMLCGTVPFKAQNMHDLHQIITNGSFSYPPQIEPLLTEEAKDLINRMLVINPKNRISIPEILSHSWMINKEELLLQDDMIDINSGSYMNRRDMYTLGQNSLSSTMNESQQEPDINQVQIDNLFLGNNSYQAKLSYTDYCAITQDFATMHMNEEALQVMEGMGFPRKLVKDGLNKGELNHATATYNLLVLS